MKFKIGPKELVVGATLLLTGVATKLDAQKNGDPTKFNDKVEYNKGHNKEGGVSKAKSLEDAFKYKGTDRRGKYTYEDPRNGQYFDEDLDNFGLDKYELNGYQQMQENRLDELIDKIYRDKIDEERNEKIDNEDSSIEDAKKKRIATIHDRRIRTLDFLWHQLKEERERRKPKYQ